MNVNATPIISVGLAAVAVAAVVASAVMGVYNAKRGRKDEDNCGVFIVAGVLGVVAIFAAAILAGTHDTTVRQCLEVPAYVKQGDVLVPVASARCQVQP